MATWYNPTAIYRILALGPGINSVMAAAGCGRGLLRTAIGCFGWARTFNMTGLVT